jgi:hypothetical protein
MKLAPIALFAYNRPDHLSRTLCALKDCPLASESELYLFVDGPRHNADRSRVEQVRAVARGVTGFKRLQVQERQENHGLSRSIIAGVTDLSRSHGRVIVLEDDLVVARGFLSFMNEALRRFGEEPRVMQVSGYMFPIANAGAVGSTMLSRVPASWGWGTWDRAWRHFDGDSNRLLALLRDEQTRHEFDLQGAYPYYAQLQLQASGQLDVWGVRWYASMSVKNGLCLYPAQSLVQNIGMDGSGLHCGTSQAFDVSLSRHETWQFPNRIEESQEALAQIREFLCRRGATTNDRKAQDARVGMWSTVGLLRRLAKARFT